MLNTRKLLLGCGIASSALYLGAIDVLAPLARPEYHSFNKMVSELFAVGAPTRELLALPMSAYNLLAFAFAAGVWAAAESVAAGRPRRAARLTAIALAVYASISTAGFFLTPMDVRGAGGVTERDVLHMVGTAAQGIAIVAALVLGALAHGTRFRVYSFATLGTALVFGALASIAAGQDSRWVGVTERVNIYAWMLWVAVLAVAFLRMLDDKTRSEPSASRRGLVRRLAQALRIV